MKQHKNLKVLSIICCIIGLVISLFGLIFGINCIGTAGWYRYNAVYIPYSIATFVILIFDLLISFHVIKNGFLFSCISSILKIGFTIFCLPGVLVGSADRLESGNFYFGFEERLFVSLIIITIPSLVNAFSEWHCFENRCLEKRARFCQNQSILLKTFSGICCIPGLLIPVYGLGIGFSSITADGFGGLGVLLLIPSIYALLTTGFDLLITVNVIKIGFLYSFASCVLKLGIAAYCIRYAISEYKENLEYGYSDFDFLIQIIVFLAIIAIPSVINTFSRWRGFKNRWFKKGTS